LTDARGTGQAAIVRPFVIGPDGIVLTDRPATAQLG
jgi:hypothetical protein